MPIVFASMLGGSDESVNLGLFESMGWVQKVNILNTPQVTLDHQVYEHNGDLVLAWNYSNRRFPKGMLSDMFQSYSRLVEAYCSENMDWSHKVQIPLPPRQQSVREKVCEVGPLPTQRTLLSGFMEQVALNPENTAVVDGDVNVSYRYLYEKATSTEAPLLPLP
jgi:non-ribosomal peptide synthetase component F